MKEKLESARKINLAAGILDIIVGACSVISFILTIVLISEIVGVGGYPNVIAIYVIGLIIAAAEIGCLLGFGIATVCQLKNKGEEYCKTKGKLLGFVVVETILVAMALVGLITAFSILSLFTFFTMVAVMILRWIGYAFVKQVAESGEAKGTLEEAKAVEKPAEKEVNIDRLQKLVELKNSGVISEEEYNILKKKELGL